MSQHQLQISSSRQFTEWLAQQQASLAFTTYQAGKLFMIGTQHDGRMAIFERSFSRCMGLCGNRQTIWMSSLYQLWRFENALSPSETYDGFDAVYVPRQCYVTGDIDIHDLAMDQDNQIVFVNTLFSCLATTSTTHSFRPLWRPPFISRLAAEDRCHLNGMATQDGKPRYVTCVAQCDSPDGWRDHRSHGGCVIDVANDEVVADRLSMPHSPRWYRDQLWLLESGSGYFGWIDFSSGKFTPVAFCPGYLRGMSFIGDFAVVGVSQSRDHRTFHGLPLDENLATRNVQPRCGLFVIDLRSGDVVHWVNIEGVVQELYDVVALHDVVRPMPIGFKSDEIRRMISIET